MPHAAPLLPSIPDDQALPTDTLEQHDRAAAEPTIFQAMQKRLDEIRETTYAPDRGALDPAACVANEKAGGYWAPWLK